MVPVVSIGRFRWELDTLSAIEEASELEAPTDENSKIRYLTHLLNDFSKRSWSFGFKVFRKCVLNRKLHKLLGSILEVFLNQNLGAFI